MHFGIFTTGSRGDVQPFVSLALGLMERGHQVTVTADGEFKDFVEGYGVGFNQLFPNGEKSHETAEGDQMIRTRNIISFMKSLHKWDHERRIPLQQGALNGSAKVDVIIVNNILSNVVSVVAEKLNKKWSIVNLNPPTIPTRQFPAWGFGLVNIPWINLLSYRLMHWLYWRLNKEDTDEFRNSLGLQGNSKPMFQVVREKNILVLNTYSTELIPCPSDWTNHVKVTGFLTLPKAKRDSHHMEQTPEGLVEWLDRGKKPVYVGFGSNDFPDIEVLTRVLNKVLSTSGQRIVFCQEETTGGDLRKDDNLFVVSRVNHEWLFPRCKAVVCHGGIGTLSAALKAGVPVIVVSIFGDQPIWGRIIAGKKLGVHIPWRKLTSGRLLMALEESGAPGIVDNVSEASRKINKEDGTKNAIEALEEFLQ